MAWMVMVPLILQLGLSQSQTVNMDNPHAKDYCPKPKDPRNVMSHAFKEQVCHTYLGWCSNMETHPFTPTKPQSHWWDVLGVGEFYKYLEGKNRGGHPSRKRGKRQSMSRAVRKDYLLLTDEERNRFHRAVQRLKSSYMDGTRTYDIFVGYHQASMAPGAHFGPGFMTWHREFILRFENALREVDPEVSLPFWNSNADSILGDAATDSILWTPAFMGNGHGLVTTGPFANFPIPFESNGQTRLYRGLNDPNERGRAPQLFHDMAVSSIVDAPTYRDIVWNVDSSYESSHGATHNWIGGVMRDLANSPSDPMFFLHHSYLDCLFERMLQKQRSRGIDVRYSYPNDTEAMGVGERQPDGTIVRRPEDSMQYALAPMAPFTPLRNIDGLRLDYTEMYYTCAPTATCSKSNLDCGSRNIFCETGVYKCAPRLKLEALCGNFSVGITEEEANPCYMSVCCEGVCSEQCENNVVRKPNRGNEEDGVDNSEVDILESSSPSENMESSESEDLLQRSPSEPETHDRLERRPERLERPERPARVNPPRELERLERRPETFTRFEPPREQLPRSERRPDIPARLEPPRVPVRPESHELGLQRHGTNPQRNSHLPPFTFRPSRAPFQERPRRTGHSQEQNEIFRGQRRRPSFRFRPERPFYERDFEIFDPFRFGFSGERFDRRDVSPFVDPFYRGFPFRPRFEERSRNTIPSTRRSSFRSRRQFI